MSQPGKNVGNSNIRVMLGMKFFSSDLDILDAGKLLTMAAHAAAFECKSVDITTPTMRLRCSGRIKETREQSACNIMLLNGG
jgi:hypothetical protein